MESVEYERMYYSEDQHWWYSGMATITEAIINRYISHLARLKILDAGCGTGSAMATYLSKYGDVTGTDVSPIALDFCRKRNLNQLILATIKDIPLQFNTYDLITSFDVLYSIDDDAQVMKEFYRILKPGGNLLLRLPANNWIRGNHDVAVHTIRRYSSAKIKRLFTIGGFSTVHISYSNTFLFPLAIIYRLILERLFPPDKGSSDLSINFGLLNSILKSILRSEAPFVARHGLPFGLSIFALGEKQILVN